MLTGFVVVDLTATLHAGTHFDAPAHFAADGDSVAEMPAQRLVVELRVVDIVTRVADDPDVEVSVADVAEHESQHGRIPDGSAAFFRTGWDRYRHDAARYFGGDAEGLRFPGCSIEAARFLVDERRVVGLGIDSPGIDAGGADGFPIHRDVTLPSGVWHVENAAHLEHVPAVGAWVVVGVPKVADAAGLPARVLALVPDPGRGVTG